MLTSAKSTQTDEDPLTSEELVAFLEREYGPKPTAAAAFDPQRPPAAAMAALKDLLQWFKDGFPYYKSACLHCGACLRACVTRDMRHACLYVCLSTPLPYLHTFLPSFIHPPIRSPLSPIHTTNNQHNRAQGPAREPHAGRGGPLRQRTGLQRHADRGVLLREVRQSLPIPARCGAVEVSGLGGWCGGMECVCLCWGGEVGVDAWTSPVCISTKPALTHRPPLLSPFICPRTNYHANTLLTITTPTPHV